MKIHQQQSADLKNPPTAKCWFEKSTNCKVLIRKIHQLQSADSKNPPTAKCLIQKPTNRSWWILIRRDRNNKLSKKLHYNS